MSRPGMARPVIGDLEHLPGFFLDTEFEQMQSGGHALHEPPLPDRPFADVALIGQVAASFPSEAHRRVPQLGTPTSHWHR